MPLPSHPALPPLALLALLLARSSFAQPAPAPPTFPLAGTVTNTATGQPVPRARVLANGIRELGGLTQVTFTDSTGAFRFPSLPAGEYRLDVQKPRFASVVSFSSPPISLTAPVENLAYSLSPLGVISGQLLDAAGDPLPLVKVQLYRQTFAEGRAVMAASGSATTNDRGEYRFPGLSAGRYLVRAVSRAGGAFLSSDDSAPPSVGRRAFAPVYAGNVEQQSQATPTDLNPGQQVQLDFRLSLLPAGRIRGVLAGLRPATPVFFELWLPGRDPITPRMFLNPASGVFTIFDLLPDTYHLRVRHGRGQEESSAEAIVTASPEPASVIHLQLQPAPLVTLQVPGGDMQSCVVALSLPASPSAFPISLRPGSSEAVPPGEYDVRPNCFGVGIESLLLGPTDLMLSRRLTIAPGAPPATLVLTRASQQTTLLLNRADPVRAAAVLVVPNAETLGAPTIHELGSLRQAALPLLPGDYTVYAVPSPLLPYRDPAFLAKLRGGVSVRLEPGRTTSATLTEVTQP